MKIKLMIVLLVVLPLFMGLMPPQTGLASSSSLVISPLSVKEGNDFATEVLNNAWDMNEIQDVSKYLNTSGVSVSLDNIQIQNGVFSAHTINSDPQFSPLFPGYIGGINTGGYGENYPVSSSKYHCLSTRMKINTDINDEIRVFWFADEQLAGGQFGVSKIIRPEPNMWKIYSLDLASDYDSANSNTHWNGRSQWQGLRIDPTKYSNKNFSVDWVRLTDCAPVPVNLTWSPVQSNVEVWMSRTSGVLETKLTGSLSGSSGSYQIDVNGWEAGNYYIGIKNLNTGSVDWSSFLIKAEPKFQIEKPSFTSGEGVRWDMNDISEILTGIGYTKCFNYSFNNGILDAQTSPPSALPSSCLASGFSDPQLVLKLPNSQLLASNYRYLTYKMNTEGAYQDINKGWVFRWLWTYYKDGDPNRWCINVTEGISIDVGWQRYALDLGLSSIGTPEYVAENKFGDCQPLLPWSQTGNIYSFRFDLNENDTNGYIYQNLDWISLNKMERVQRGRAFPIYVDFQTEEDLNVSLFYTSTRDDPDQHSVQLITPTTVIPSGSNAVYLPLLQNNNNVGLKGTVYQWDTNNVSVNQYYICVKAEDNVGNISIHCSEAPVEVY